MERTKLGQYPTWDSQGPFTADMFVGSEDTAFIYDFWSRAVIYYMLHVDLFGRHLSAQADQIWNYCSTFTSHQEPNKDKPNFKTARILRFPPQFERLLLQVWEKIPDSLDILMTHGPAYSIPAKSILQEGAAGR